MKNKLFIPAGIIMLVLLYGFISPFRTDSQVDDFKVVKLKINAHVFLKQGNTNEVKINAPEKVKDEIVTDVEGETLTIKYKNLKSWKSIKKLIPEKGINIYVTMKEVEGLAVAGSGDISADGAIEGDDLVLKISGSGDIIIPKLMADELSIGIAGSGNVKIGGEADDLTISIAGSGDINAGSLDVDDAYVKISGSGNCEIGESDELKIAIAGSGDLKYRGNPDVIKKIAGSGSVKRIK
jgi:hypothetical protein